MATKEDLIYIAAIIDTNSYLGIEPHYNKPEISYNAVVKVTQANETIARYFLELFGGAIRNVKPEKPTHKPCWVWRSNSKDIISFLSAVYPYLKVRQRQAEILIAYRDTVDPKNGPTPPGIKALRESLYLQLEQLSEEGIRRKIRNKKPHPASAKELL